MNAMDVLEIAGLIHGRWAEAFETLKTVKNETNDGSPDWRDFHTDRLHQAQAAETYWAGVKSRFMDANREVFEEMLTDE